MERVIRRPARARRSTQETEDNGGSIQESPQLARRMYPTHIVIGGRLQCALQPAPGADCIVCRSKEEAGRRESKARAAEEVASGGDTGGQVHLLAGSNFWGIQSASHIPLLLATS